MLWKSKWRQATEGLSTWRSSRIQVKQGTDQSSLMSQPCSCISCIKHFDTPSLPSHPTSGSLSTNLFYQSCSFLLSWLINSSPFSHLRVSVKSPKRTCPLKIITILLPPTSEPPIAFQLCYKTNNLYFKVANWYVFLKNKLCLEQGAKDQYC